MIGKGDGELMCKPQHPRGAAYSVHQALTPNPNGVNFGYVDRLVILQAKMDNIQAGQTFGGRNRT